LNSRTIVVGAGVLGLSIAERVAARGHDVTLVDRGEPGFGTSRTSFGWLNSNSKAPPSYQRLNVAGVDRYHELIGTPKTSQWLHLNGRIEWGVGPDEIEAIESVAETMRKQGYPVEAITPQAARHLEPDLLVPDDAEVLFWPSEGYLIPSPYIEWLLERVRARTVELLVGVAVDRFLVKAGRVQGVRLVDGSIRRADYVISCVGRWTEALVATANVYVPMQPLLQGSPAMGLLGYSTPVRTRLARTISTPTLSVRADTPSGRYVLQRHGLDHLAVPDAPPEPDGDIGMEILTRARATMAGFESARLAEIRVGYRSVPADRVTVAGWAPSLENFYVVATHSGYTLALHLGELVAREVVDGAEEPTLAEFRLERFARSVDAGEVEARPVH
jgi:glycine/D-amino acid oxidase-like deaminating enzyme